MILWCWFKCNGISANKECTFNSLQPRNGMYIKRIFLSLVWTGFVDIHLNIDIWSKHFKHFEARMNWIANQWRCLELLLNLNQFNPILWDPTSELIRVHKLNKQSLTYGVISRRKWTLKLSIHRYHLTLEYELYT